MTTNELIAAIEASLAQYRAELAPPEPPAPLFMVVAPGEDLQAALNTSAVPVHLMEGGTYPNVTLPSGARLVGNGAAIVGQGKPALWVKPGTSDVMVEHVVCRSDGWNGAVVQIGDNDAVTQGTLALVPHGITLAGVSVPTHRGKRAFEINAADVLLSHCDCRDVHTTTGQDSQGISIMNTPGPVTVNGGTFEAGSENIMIGGSTIKIPGVIPTDITFDGVTLTKPESWKTDGVKRAPKNLFEVKAGRNVTLRNSTLSGSWKSTVLNDPTQDGYAFVITPKDGLFIEGVLVENCVIDRCGTGVQFLGKDYQSLTTPHLTSGVVFRDCQFTVSKTAYNGRNWFALYVDSMTDALFDNCTISHEGVSILFVDSSAPTGPFTMRSCTVPTGAYGIQAPGANYGNVGTVGKELTVVLEGNMFNTAAMTSGGRTAFKANFPGNNFTP